MNTGVRADRAFNFNQAISRSPSDSVVDGIRLVDTGNPDPHLFAEQHQYYLDVLSQAGVEVTLLGALEAFPDSVFVEDAALCIDGAAIALRPGANSRRGETAALLPTLHQHFPAVIELEGDGLVDGGDVLLGQTDAFIGLSERTNEAGFAALSHVLADFGYTPRRVDTPAEILHFKSDCGLLDNETVFTTTRLAATGCFTGYKLIEAPSGEEAAANLVRINDTILLNDGYPESAAMLRNNGYHVVQLPMTESAKVDGGLSCMSLRFYRTD